MKKTRRVIAQPFYAEEGAVPPPPTLDTSRGPTRSNYSSSNSNNNKRIRMEIATMIPMSTSSNMRGVIKSRRRARTGISSHR